VADFHHQDDQALIVDFVDDPVVSASDLVKGVAALHLGGGRVWEVGGQIGDSFLDPHQVSFREVGDSLQDGRAEFDGIDHLQPQLVPEL